MLTAIASVLFFGLRLSNLLHRDLLNCFFKAAGCILNHFDLLWQMKKPLRRVSSLDFLLAGNTRRFFLSIGNPPAERLESMGCLTCLASASCACYHEFEGFMISGWCFEKKKTQYEKPMKPYKNHGRFCFSLSEMSLFCFEVQIFSSDGASTLAPRLFRLVVWRRKRQRQNIDLFFPNLSCLRDGNRRSWRHLDVSHCLARGLKPSKTKPQILQTPFHYARSRSVSIQKRATLKAGYPSTHSS